MSSTPTQPEQAATTDRRSGEDRAPSVAEPDRRTTSEGLAEPPPCETRAAPEVVEAACRFAAARGRPAAVFLLAEGNAADGTPDMPITRRSVGHLATALDTDPSFDDLDLVVQSTGGDIHAAYQMMSFLRARMTGKGELVACVPRKAQSSATLLCLGGDRILLDVLGALGPLDAQIRVGLTDAGTPDYASALHLIKGLNRLQEFSLDTLTEAAANLYDNRVRRNDDILRYAIEFSRGITAPLFERIESHRIGYWDQMLRTGEAYGRRLLRRGRLIFEVPDMEREEHVSAVIHQLVFEYPSHEYVIDREELVDKLHLRADTFPAGTTSAVRELAKYSSDTLLMLVYPPGTAVPPGMQHARRSTLRDWSTSGGSKHAQTLFWESDTNERFLMRVGLYRGPLKASRNPWRDRTARSGDPAPSEQYFAGDRPSWSG
jgi:hypothetical protein